MTNDHSELSSIATTLADLTDRVTAAAERLRAARDEGVAADLFDVERSLRAATRRLDATLRRMSQP